MRPTMLALAAATMLLAASGAALGATAIDSLLSAAGGCEEVCSWCVEAFQRQCGGSGWMRCGSSWWSERCYCEFDCDGPLLTDLESAI